MESLSPAEDNFSTQKIMAVLGALCILYFLFSPLPEQYRDDSLIIYMVKGSGEQWALLGIALLTAVLVYFRFWALAVFASICLILTTLWTTLWGVFHSWLMWTLLTAGTHRSAITDSSLFLLVDKFLLKHILPKGYVGVLWAPNQWFQNVSVLQTLVLLLGTILLFIASVQEMRKMLDKQRSAELART